MKTYNQYCGLAKALDRIGDRWTMLIVRELLLGPRRYTQIRSALPGIATNLLADRLRELQAEGVIERAGTDGAYELTELGRGLEPIIHGLVRWGANWMGPRETGEAFRPEWLAVALAALLPKRRGIKLQVNAGETTLNIKGGRVSLGSVERPAALIEGSPEMVLGVAAGQLPLAVLKITGDQDAAAQIFGASQTSGKPLS